MWEHDLFPNTGIHPAPMSGEAPDQVRGRLFRDPAPTGSIDYPERTMTTVKEFLVTRLAEIGGTHMFGVPGNYNAEFLLAAQQSGKLSYTGTTNELEAGYAADAYARLTRRIGICCVTYGVGSFSLL